MNQDFCLSNLIQNLHWKQQKYSLGEKNKISLKKNGGPKQQMLFNTTFLS